MVRYLSAALARLITIRNSELDELLDIDIRDLIDDEEMEEQIHRSLTEEEREQARTAMKQSTRESSIRDERTEKLIHNLSSMASKHAVKKMQPGKPGTDSRRNEGGEDEKDRTIALLKEQLAEAKQKLSMTEAGKK